MPTPCERCFPGVHFLNEPANRIYQAISNQYNHGMGGAVAMSIEAAEIVFNWFRVDIEEREELWNKVCYLSDIVLECCLEEQKQKRAAQNQQGV